MTALRAVLLVLAALVGGYSLWLFAGADLQGGRHMLGLSAAVVALGLVTAGLLVARRRR